MGVDVGTAVYSGKQDIAPRNLQKPAGSNQLNYH